MKKIQARDLRRQDLMQHISVTDTGTYTGILRHFTHAQDGVHVFITSSDNAVIIGSLRLDPTHQITIPGATK